MSMANLCTYASDQAQKVGMLMGRAHDRMQVPRSRAEYLKWLERQRCMQFHGPHCMIPAGSHTTLGVPSHGIGTSNWKSLIRRQVAKNGTSCFHAHVRIMVPYRKSSRNRYRNRHFAGYMQTVQHKCSCSAVSVKRLQHFLLMHQFTKPRGGCTDVDALVGSACRRQAQRTSETQMS